MMKLTLTLFLFVLSLAAEAAAPSLSCSYSRTSGTAPLAVQFDCSATTDADTTKPFHDLLYTTTFGDPGAGQWANGANTNAGKNFAVGPIGAHVYEDCSISPATITTTVTDGTNIARTTQSITIDCADTIYAGTATKCYTNGTDFTGCPSGATQTGSTSDYDAAIIACLGTTKRCLFKRGDTFTQSVDLNYNNAGPMTIGAFGTGAKPIINLNSGITWMEPAGATFGDFRAMDLDIRGGGVAAHGFVSNFANTNITFLRLDMSAIAGENIAFSTSGCTKCVIQDSNLATNSSAASVYLHLFSGAVLGNIIGPVSSGGEHALRVQQAQNSVFAHNTVTTSRPNKEVFALRAEPHVTTAQDSFYNVVSDNKIIQGTLAAILFQTSNGGGTDVRIYDILFERNWLTGNSIPGSGFTCTYIRNVGTRVTIRNNLFTMAECGDGASGILVLREGASDPSPTDVNIYNNTLYTAVAKQYLGIELQANATNTIVKNNLCWFDVGTGGTVCVSDGGSGTTNPTQPTAGGNSSTAQTTGTDPSFDTPLTSPIGFRIGTGSYASNVGVAIYPASNDDFFNCDDTTSNERLGAFVPRTRATCRGAAGP